MGNEVVVTGALMSCSYGAAPCSFIALPVNNVTASFLPAATVNDYAPLVNIPTFGTCSSLSNPTVSAATSAAMGVLTPMPCIPVVTSAWSPGSPTTKFGGAKALTKDSTCNCTWGGKISFSTPGEFVFTC